MPAPIAVLNKDHTRYSFSLVGSQPQELAEWSLKLGPNPWRQGEAEGKGRPLLTEWSFGKGTYVCMRLVLGTALVGLFTHLPESQSLHRGLNWVQSHIPFRWSQQHTLSRSGPWNWLLVHSKDREEGEDSSQGNWQSRPLSNAQHLIGQNTLEPGSPKWISAQMTANHVGSFLAT